MLADGMHDVPRGKVATVVTHLEMRTAPDLPATPAPAGCDLHRVQAPSVDWYRDIFRAVGANWLWFSRLDLDDAALTDVIHDPNVLIWTIRHDGRDAALLELDFRQQDACELAFFGLIPALIGTGAGRFLMAHATREAWARPITRFWVHTCTHDSPQALAFYRRAGFVPFRQQIEIADDPRVTAGFDRALAPHVPIYD